ncbi:peroxiredoxin [Desulfobaculum senezii]|jgi:peroxiredoxin (alkyl hydroperoxide reductase subunit C)|uniref:peroxiredoxin n=1 Tax=Desulfobaculum sp. SPO524 TaxID=3378071 RepID=UPI003853B321
MENRIPLLGEKFPEMKVVTTQGEKNLPGDYKGKWFVLFSHPADFTPVCTTEFVAFQKRIEQFNKLNCELIGLSIDQVFSHIKWVEWIGEKIGEEITFPVIADDRGKVAETLGMLHPGKGSNTVRAVFVIDPEGHLRLMLYYPQEVGRNMDEILRAVEALQTSDANGVAIPAGWPKNELIGSRVIVPPAQDHEAAKKRLSEYDGYDWWFCHKEL